MAAMIIASNDMDRISELPEAMKLEILSRLPAEDGVEMSTVSKTWKSLPISYFSFTRRTRHINSIDKSLAILHEDQKRIIHCFRVWRIVEESDLIHVDRWLNLITKHIIREIVLDFSFYGKSRKYRFPPTRFDVGSLMVLKLYDCVLDETLIQKDTGFNRLKELTLFNTDFDGVVVELLSRSPNLETLILKPSRGSINKYIELCDLPKLKKVKVWPHEGYSYKIEAANLQTLMHIDLIGFGPPPDLGALICGNIKEITMHLGTVTLEYIAKLISKFQFLEELILHASIVSKEQQKVSRYFLDKLQDYYTSKFPNLRACHLWGCYGYGN